MKSAAEFARFIVAPVAMALTAGIAGKGKKVSKSDTAATVASNQRLYPNGRPDLCKAAQVAMDSCVEARHCAAAIADAAVASARDAGNRHAPKYEGILTVNASYLRDPYANVLIFAARFKGLDGIAAEANALMDKIHRAMERMEFLSRAAMGNDEVAAIDQHLAVAMDAGRKLDELCSAVRVMADLTNKCGS